MRRRSSISARRRAATRFIAVYCGVLGAGADASAAERRDALNRAIADGIVDAADEPFAADLLAIPQTHQGRYEAMDNEARTEGKLHTLAAAVEAHLRRNATAAPGRGRALGVRMGAFVPARACVVCAAAALHPAPDVAARRQRDHTGMARHRDDPVRFDAAGQRGRTGLGAHFPHRQSGSGAALRRARAGQSAVPDATAAQWRRRRDDSRNDPERRAGPARRSPATGQGGAAGRVGTGPAFRASPRCDTCCRTPTTTARRCWHATW